jgi:chemotaxis protein MotB
MKKLTLATLGVLALLLPNACVKQKIYRAELAARSAAEAREKVLVQELLDRKRETSQLVKTTENLARDLGKQDTEIADLKEQLAATTRSMGESASKLAGEKASLEKNLASANVTLEQRNSLISKVKSVQDKRKSILAELESAVAKVYQPFSAMGVTVQTSGDQVLLTLPDAALFETGGLAISAKGKELLQPLAEMLAARPSLTVEMQAFTDNVLPPKEKTLKDTWDWSLLRATNVVRMLIRDYNVNANQLTPVGKGEFYPVVSNETPDGRQKNRRTIAVIKPVLPTVPAAE